MSASWLTLGDAVDHYCIVAAWFGSLLTVSVIVVCLVFYQYAINSVVLSVMLYYQCSVLSLSLCCTVLLLVYYLQHLVYYQCQITRSINPIPSIVLCQQYCISSGTALLICSTVCIISVVCVCVSSVARDYQHCHDYHR